MVVQDFLDRMSKMEVLTYVGLDDWFDRLNFIFTVWILMLMCSITTVKTYFLQPIICYIPNIVGSHEGQAAYITNYCYTEGTYNVPLTDFKVDNQNPRWMDAYKDKKIYYYQWLPFVLGVQGVMCYLPRIIWYLFVNNRSGIDLSQLVRQTVEVQKADGDRRDKLVKHLCKQIELWAKANMPIHNSKCQGLRSCCMRWTPAMLISKRLGTWLVVLYLVVKLVYIGNSIGQLFLMTKLLQLSSLPANQNSSLLGITASFGISLLSDLLQGKDWQNTEAFPRSGCCAIETRQAASSQYIFAQCALPVNMIHEKVFIFLWFWFVFLLGMNLASVPLWIARFWGVNRRTANVMKYLRLSGVVSKTSEHQVKGVRSFCREFLRFDGLFLVHMLALNAGEVVATDMCRELYAIYEEKYRDTLENAATYPSGGSGGKEAAPASAHENGRTRQQDHAGRERPHELAPLVNKSISNSSLFSRRGGHRKGLHPVNEEAPTSGHRGGPDSAVEAPSSPVSAGAGGKEPSAPPLDSLA